MVLRHALVVSAVSFGLIGGAATAQNTIVTDGTNSNLQHCNEAENERGKPVTECDTIITLPGAVENIEEVCNDNLDNDNNGVVNDNCIVFIPTATPVTKTPVPPTQIPNTPVPPTRTSNTPVPQTPIPTTPIVVIETPVPPVVNTEVCDDEVDNDSDGFVDEDCTIGVEDVQVRGQTIEIAALPNTGVGISANLAGSVMLVLSTITGFMALKNRT